MNRIYKLVWNAARGVWAVASELGRSSRACTVAQGALAAVLLGLAGTAAADCTSAGNTITCAPGTGQTTLIGSGGASASGLAVDVLANAQISTGNRTAISTGDNATIVVRSGATVQNNAGAGASGIYGTGGNTIEFRSGNQLTILQGATVVGNGTASTAEAVNAMGSNNVIVNHGALRSQGGGAAIWFETSSGFNTVVNGATGVIDYKGGAGSIFGAAGTMAVDFTNQGALLGNLAFANGDDTLRLHTGSTISGSIDGGGGRNLLTLNGTGTGSFARPLSNFQTLVKNDTGTWTFNTALQAAGITSTRVAGGTLVLGSSAANYTGTMAVDAAGTLQTSAQFAPLAVSNDGLVRFAQPDAASYAGLISGSGGIEKSGAGTLVLNRVQAVTGVTAVSAGTLKAGATNMFSPASAHTVAAGATLDTAGFSQTLSSLTNAGMVSLLSGTAGSTLTVTGAYVGNGGALRLGTVLGSSASTSDRLLLDGATASARGRTTVQITNLGGLGALTTGNGIEVVAARNGATTTAQTTRDAFALAGGHVDAGAYEYRLYAGDVNGAGESWYLSSASRIKVVPPAPVEEPPATTPGGPAGATPSTPAPTATTAVKAPVPAAATPMYRAEVPLLAALPAQLRQADLAMLGNLHRRVGDATGAGGVARNSWARAVYADLAVRQGGTVDAQSQGHVSGVQAGVDLFVTPAWRAGVYVGSLEGEAAVSGQARGSWGRVGRNDLQSRYIGGYATWRNEAGAYADAVLQAGSHRYGARPDGNAAVSGRAGSLAASLEVGQSFALADGWTIEPQAQIAHQKTRIDDVSIGGAQVRQDAAGGWVGRLGVRLKGDLATRAGRLQPYARINLYRGAGGTDVARFTGPAGATDIASSTRYTAAELAGGFTLALTPGTSLYGELGRVYGTGGGSSVKSSVQGSVGLRMQWF
ncbi:autotransporter outer membrane beta-barrel domain-containing protein [Variovorax fucosicus]|uniref:autotransporter outer membrane beta-barrel domain-containing protein n=1 Tax=Variovorax fucosicus TaxID=3053517 RepID=UPI00257830B9|nr:autotransporter outer membrane beta-barrel domain-containing protein [Variovorax sp. J22G47]MDM0059281.1 autotransporter outer membrane beta-barrel domain-containing protein [Variovorax sp. J22G47]